MRECYHPRRSYSLGSSLRATKLALANTHRHTEQRLGRQPAGAQLYGAGQPVLEGYQKYFGEYPFKKDGYKLDRPAPGRSSSPPHLDDDEDDAATRERSDRD